MGCLFLWLMEKLLLLFLLEVAWAIVVVCSAKIITISYQQITVPSRQPLMLPQRIVQPLNINLHNLTIPNIFLNNLNFFKYIFPTHNNHWSLFISLYIITLFLVFNCT